MAPPGTSRLEVAWVDGSSAVTRAFATSPMKLLVPRPRGVSAWIYSSSFGGGLVAGDRTSLDLSLGPGTRAFVGTQSSTKIYRNPGRHASGHATTARLGAGSLLVFAPDPAQLFAHSTYCQRQEFHLAGDANLALVDGFSPGRVACGERWAFDHYASRNSVRVDDVPIYLDAVRLDPADGALDSPFRGGRHGCLATLVLVGPALAEAAKAVFDDVSGREVGRRDETEVAASRIRGGVVVRIGADGAESVGRELRRWLAPVAPLLGDDPWQRKW
ncbi:MAG: urease accessory protein UreD [Verrucomicrobia bacterium]|nr:MAG: urease accessory protein UreD [Verrucomicrobiota bacterium]